MLTYDLEQATGPLYQYIYQCLKDDIMTGVTTGGGQTSLQENFCQESWY